MSRWFRTVGISVFLIANLAFAFPVLAASSFEGFPGTCRDSPCHVLPAPGAENGPRCPSPRPQAISGDRSAQAGTGWDDSDE